MFVIIGNLNNIESSINRERLSSVGLEFFIKNDNLIDQNEWNGIYELSKSLDLPFFVISSTNKDHTYEYPSYDISLRQYSVLTEIISHSLNESSEKNCYLLTMMEWDRSNDRLLFLSGGPEQIVNSINFFGGMATAYYMLKTSRIQVDPYLPILYHVVMPNDCAI